MAKSVKKIGIITTLNTNIGDDFIRTGIQNLIHSILGDNVKYTLVCKHIPDSSLKNQWIKKLIDKIPNIKGKSLVLRLFYNYIYHRDSVFNNQDLIIQSGAPVLWPNCQNNEWAKPLWYQTIGKLYKKIPVLNLAAGSCYPWENYGNFHSEEEAKYASDIGGFCVLTTTRDKLANKLFNDAGVENDLLSCSAFFVDPTMTNDATPEYIIINAMEGAGHFSWNQDINNLNWEKQIRDITKELIRNYSVKFVAHNDKEVEYASKFVNSEDIFYPKSVSEYLQIINKGIIGINNRMHASVAMASVGVPTISICTDTRLFMLEEIGQKIYYVKDIKENQLIDQINKLLVNRDLEHKKLFEIKQNYFLRYQKLLQKYL